MFESLANIATALGLPAIILVFLYEVRASERARDRETHLELSRRYGDYLRLCMSEPELQLFDTLSSDAVRGLPGTDTMAHKRLAALQVLVSLFEDAFYLFSSESTPLKKQAWAGWEKYIEYWMRRQDFRSAWIEHLSFHYNKSFMEYMDRVLRSTGVSTPGPEE